MDLDVSKFDELRFHALIQYWPTYPENKETCLSTNKLALSKSLKSNQANGGRTTL